MFMEKNRGYGLNNLYRLTTVHVLPELLINLHCVVQRVYDKISFPSFQDRPISIKLGSLNKGRVHTEIMPVFVKMNTNLKKFPKF